MAGTKGNKNAEKWTVSTVMEILSDMIDTAKFGGVYHINELLKGHDLGAQRWYDWKKKFSKSKIVLEAIKKVESYLEANLVTDAIKGDTNTTMTIFLLKNKYNYEERTKQETEYPDIKINFVSGDKRK